MSASKSDLATGIPTDPSNDQHRPQSRSSPYFGTGKRRRYEFEDSTLSHESPEPSKKRRHLDIFPPFLTVDTSPNTSPNTSQIAVAEQLPSPEVTNSSQGRQHTG